MKKGEMNTSSKVKIMIKETDKIPSGEVLKSSTGDTNTNASRGEDDESSFFEVKISPEISSRVIAGRPQDKRALQTAVSKKQLALFTSLSQLPSQKDVENKIKSSKLLSIEKSSSNQINRMTTASKISTSSGKQREKLQPILLEAPDRISRKLDALDEVLTFKT
jgi:hypothetical protein